MSIKATRGDSYSLLICLFPCLLSFSGLHQSLPPGERDLCGQEEDQVGEEVSGPPLQPGPGLLREPAGESGAGEKHC